MSFELSDIAHLLLLAVKRNHLMAYEWFGGRRLQLITFQTFSFGVIDDRSPGMRLQVSKLN